DKVQKELDLQREVSQEFSKNMQATSAFINSKKDKLKEELKQENLSPEQRAQYEKELAQWNSGGLILNAIGAGLAAPTNSIGGIVAATASPALSYQIGQYFKGKDAEGSTAHLVAHAVLGAAVAAAGGNNALAGGLAAAGAEATAPIVSKWLYGKDAKDLTADEKATVSAIAGLTGAATGAVVSGSMADVAQGNQAGHTAVDNNRLIVTGEKAAKKRYLDLLNKAQKQYKYKLDAKNRIVIDGYHYDDSQNPPVLVSDNPNGGVLNPTDVANKTIIDAINKNEDIYLRLISDPKIISQDQILIDDFQTGNIDVTKDFFQNSDPNALMQSIIHYIKEREQTNNYEGIKSTVNNNNRHLIFTPGHNAGILAELNYLQELYPNKNFIYQYLNPHPILTTWKGKSVLVKIYNYGGVQQKIYFDYKIDSIGRKIPIRPIGVSY
ncbi:VENN motif pre-toxin domain-containing protein, partial [Snodgrassella communis]|uniref:VENN motif pre-toxin domain-containing protein n=1 Tax=Snodgrassella communis TaxID=2946699 RepID=UPI001C557ECB